MATSHSKVRRPAEAKASRSSSSATHPSAFVTPTAISEYGVVLGDQAIPLVIDHFQAELASRGLAPAANQSGIGDSARLPQPVASAIGIALFTALRPERGQAPERTWSSVARIEASANRL